VQVVVHSQFDALSYSSLNFEENLLELNYVAESAAFEVNVSLACHQKVILVSELHTEVFQSTITNLEQRKNNCSKLEHRTIDSELATKKLATLPNLRQRKVGNTANNDDEFFLQHKEN
jgi:hypothetical protein